MGKAEEVARSFVAAFGRIDRAAAQGLLANEVVGDVTNAAAGIDEVVGADARVTRLPSRADA